MPCSYLFVYGTLRGDSSHEMATLLRQYAEPMGRATYQGRLYRVDWYPGVVPSMDPQDQVQGDLYQIKDAEFLLPQLDRYEECGPGFPEPTEYIRSLQEVRDQNGQGVTAWIYLYQWSIDDSQWIRSGEFVEDR